MALPTSTSEWDETFSHISRFISISMTEEKSRDSRKTDKDARNAVGPLRRMRKQLEIMIEHSQHIQATLIRREAEVQECIRGLETLFSPARRLPPELIGEIFQQFSKSEAASHLPLRRSRFPSPLILAQVSQSWRSAALAMPAMWSSIHITIPEEIELSHASRISHLAQLWMERSGKSFLTLHLTIFHKRAPSQSSQADQHKRRSLGVALHMIFAPLLQHSQRWHKLYFDVTPLGMICLLAEYSLASFVTAPALELFQFKGGIKTEDFRWLEGHPFRLGPWFNLSSAKSLRYLLLSDIGLFIAHEHSFGWAHLEEISLTGINFTISGSDCMFALKECRRLKRLNLTCSENTRVFGGLVNSVIVLDSLEIFSITSYCLPDMGDIYRLLVCPNLQDFGFRYLPQRAEEIHHHHFPWLPASILGFLANSRCLLKLHLWNVPILEDGIISIMELASSITHLTVVFQKAPYFAGDGFLQRLSLPPSEEGSLLKNMEYIHIESRTYSEHFIREFIESRLQGKLKKIRLGLQGTEASLYSDLEKYATEGLVVEILAPSVLPCI